MKFTEYDTVQILSKKSEYCGNLGVIVMTFSSPKEAYEVEILDEEKNTIGQDTFFPDELKLFVLG